MANGKNFIPVNSIVFMAWMMNFYTQLLVLAAKYGVGAEKLTQHGKDNDWVQYWTQAKVNAKQQEKQLNDFIEGVANGNLGAPELSAPTWALLAGPPVGVPPGIKKRVRETAAFIKSQKSIYTRADGELLGIVTAEEAGLTEQDYTAVLKLTELFSYNTEADFRKFGLEAIRIEYRRKDGSWELAAILTRSPGIFNINPTVAGNAEQIEIRAILIFNNQPFGNYSPIYTITIKP